MQRSDRRVCVGERIFRLLVALIRRHEPQHHDYVIGGALEVFFYILGQQDKEIPTNFMVRPKPLLKEAFGKI